MIAAEPPPPLPPSSERSPWPFGKFPGARRKKILIIIGGIVVVAVIIAAILATISAARQNQQTTISEFAPKVKFIKFEAEKHEIQVGQSTSILFNVQNSEDKVINDAKVVVTIDPEVGNNYLSISNNTIKLPAMNTQARTGDIEVTITATGTPAREAVYVIKGVVSAEGTMTDVSEFRLTIRQPQQQQ
jgi:hypothetical protein